MELTSVLVIAAGSALAIAVLIIVWRVMVRRSRLSSETPESLQQVAEARLEPGEKPASLISEQIEEMVRKQLAQYPDLAAVELDFGTAADGSLEIRVGGQQYADPAQVPDERIRAAIMRAVQLFNR